MRYEQWKDEERARLRKLLAQLEQTIVSTATLVRF
jgi:hypothetical protein